MNEKWNNWVAVLVTSLGISLVILGILAVPKNCYAGSGPACNEGADPSMPKGCVGWCYSPKICQAHPIQLVCKCR